MAVIIKILTVFILLLITACGRSPFEGSLVKSNGEPILGRVSQTSSYSFEGLSLIFNKSLDFVLYEENAVEILVKNKAGEYIDFEFTEYDFYLWMPEHGHGSYPLSVKRTTLGKVIVAEMYFTMPGFWQLVISNKKTNKELKWSIYL